MVRSLTLVCAALVFACVSSRPALGQVNAGGILVKAVDEQSSVMPGVTVVITSPVLLTGEQSAVTDSTRHVSLHSASARRVLRPVRAGRLPDAHQGNVVVSVSQTPPLDLLMKVATLEETVTVTGESAVVDTTTANVQTPLTEEVLQGTPGGDPSGALINQQQFLSPTSILAPRVFRAAPKC